MSYDDKIKNLRMMVIDDFGLSALLPGLLGVVTKYAPTIIKKIGGFLGLSKDDEPEPTPIRKNRRGKNTYVKDFTGADFEETSIGS